MRTLRATALPLPSTSPPIRSAFCEAPSRRREPASRTSWRNSPTSSTPERLQREEATYTRLLAALAELVIVPDRDVLDVLGDLAGVIDDGNEYRRVVSEHEALHSLLAQLRG
jgi:hypothetical protein